MARVLCLCVVAAICVGVRGLPTTAQRMYTQHAQEQINPLNYYLESQENYFGPGQKQDVNHVQNGAPARLETLEPDNDAELIPGVQPPQQPPQQPPVAPNLPGLLPGQRVFIVHMPIPGYRPGTIGGYQPVYIVAAAPQGNPGFPGNGFQNAVLLDPSGQAVSPVLGYQKGAVLTPQHNPGLILGGPLALTRPLDYTYQDYSNPGAPILQAVDGIRAIHLGQQILQGPVQGHAAPIPPAHQANRGAPNLRGGETEALVSPKDTSQAIKEDAQKGNVRPSNLPRKV